MSKKSTLLAAGVLAAVMLTACGQNKEMKEFKNEVDDFCTFISEMDTAINSIDPEAADPFSQLLGYLDELDVEFQKFAELDFPEEFDYLEDIADESGNYMAEAVKSYHEAYGTESGNEAAAAYARENYSRAYKRIQIIISFLHGEEPADVDLSISTE